MFRMKPVNFCANEKETQWGKKTTDIAWILVYEGMYINGINGKTRSLKSNTLLCGYVIVGSDSYKPQSQKCNSQSSSWHKSINLSRTGINIMDVYSVGINTLSH